MATKLPDKRLVYLALKEIFKGEDARIRRVRKITELIQKHQNENGIRSLVKKHNTDDICNVAKTLLKEQIFESISKARLSFPEMFKASSNQSIEQAISKAGSAKTETDAIECVAKRHQSVTTVNDYGCDVNGAPKGSEITLEGVNTLSGSSVSPLYPIYLPFDVQHRVLIGVQHVLERACYAFGQKKLGSVLLREKWDCAEAVELNHWPKIFLTYQNELFANELEDLGKSFSELLDSIIELRHTAVHRIRVSADKTEQFIIDSESLAKLLQEDVSVQTISRWRHEIQHAIEGLKRNKVLLESRLTAIKTHLTARRAELDCQELDAVENTLKEDREYLALVKTKLDQAVVLDSHQ